MYHRHKEGLMMYYTPRHSAHQSKELEELKEKLLAESLNRR